MTFFCISIHLLIYFFKKPAIYYIEHGGSPCLLDVGYEPTTLTAREQDITNVVERFTTMPSHPLLICFPIL